MKTIGLVLVSIILCLILSGHNKQFSTLLAIGICAMVAIAAMAYIRPILEFFTQLQARGSWNSDLLSILLRVTGIGILSEIVTLVCSDTGNASLGKALQFMTVATILWLSLPLFESLLEIVEQLLGKL